MNNVNLKLKTILLIVAPKNEIFRYKSDKIYICKRKTSKLTKGVKEDLNKCRNNPCSWIERFNSIKI